MDSGFSYGDLIVLGAIAVFVLLRYRAMLGENSGRDETPRPKPAPISDYERVIQLPSARLPVVEAKKEDFSEKYGTLAEKFVAMRAIDREFAPDEFLTGARAAYEMVIDAFSKGDRSTLKMLLSDEIYKSFDLSLSDAEKAGRKQVTTLVAITKAVLSDAKLVGSKATLTVEFLSEQIHLIRNPEGEIIDGNPSLHEPVEDRWEFSRNLNSTDPNWKIIET